MIRLVALITLLLSCKKESIPKGAELASCWQVVDPFGNDINALCNKTLPEMQSLYPNSCNYFKIDGEKFCWFIDGRFFLPNATETSIKHYLKCYGGAQAVKVGCDYCHTWYTRDKHTYKPDHTFFYSPVHLQQYCGDTVKTLFQGREIIVRESPDFLITLQFSNNGIFL